MIVRSSKGGAARRKRIVRRTEMMVLASQLSMTPPPQTSTMTMYYKVLPYCKYDLMFESWNSVPEPNWGPWGTCFLGHQIRYNRNCPSIRYVWLFHNFSMNNVLAADINSISLIIFEGVSTHSYRRTMNLCHLPPSLVHCAMQCKKWLWTARNGCEAQQRRSCGDKDSKEDKDSEETTADLDNDGITIL